MPSGSNMHRKRYMKHFGLLERKTLSYTRAKCVAPHWGTFAGNQPWIALRNINWTMTSYTVIAFDIRQKP